MSTIDNRIVNMVFNNKEFEQGIKDSTKALNNFDRDLNSLANSGSALNSISDAVSKIADRFTWFGDLTFRIMGRVKESIIDVLSSITSEAQLIVNPFAEINAGFDEFESKMGAVQTIMAGVRGEFNSEAEALAAVNEKLDELNAYSDRTIYSFRDMTSNISKFTNAGVKLNDAVAAIQGVANVAAISGANANEAARAMYNFGQAMGSGVVRLQDWRSISFANMDTVEFKNNLIDAAVATGTLSKALGNTYAIGMNQATAATQKGMTAQELFIDGLKDGWLTTEVLVKTLSDYASTETEIGKRANAAAQDVKTFSMMMDSLKESLGSGWAQSFEIIIGNFTEGKALWTDVNDVLTNLTETQSNLRNEYLQLWKNLGGRNLLIDSIANAFQSLGSILSAVGSAFANIFPPSTAYDLYNITVSFKNFVDYMKPSEQTLNRLRRAFEGLFAVIDIILIPFELAYQGLKQIITILNTKIGEGDSIIGYLTEFIAKIGDSVKSIRDFIRNIDIFSVGIKSISEGIISLLSSINLTNIFDYISNSWNNLMSTFETEDSALSNTLLYISDSLNTLMITFRNFTHTISNYLYNLSPNLADFFINAYNSISKFTSGLKNINLSIFDNLKQKINDLNTNESIFGNIIAIIRKFIEDNQAIWDWFANIWTSFKEAVGPVIDWFIEKIKTMTVGDASLLLFSRGFQQLGAGISGLANTLNGSGLSQLLDALTTPFIKVGEIISAPFKAVGDALNSLTATVNSASIRSIAISVAILAASLAGLSFINGDQLDKALIALTALFAELIGSFITLQKVGSGAFALQIGKLIGVAISIGILANALVNLSKITTGKLQPALIAMTGLLVLLTAFIKLNQGNALSISSIQLIAFGWAITDMSDALFLLSSLSMDQIINALVGLAGALTAVYGFTKLVDPAKLSASGGGLAGIAFGMLILSASIAILGNMDLETLGKGILAIGGALLTIGGSLKLLPIKGGAILIAIAAGLTLLTIPIIILGSLSLETLAKGILSIAAAIIMLGGVSSIVNYTSLLKLSGVLPLLAIGLISLAIPIALLGSLSFKTLATGIVGFAAAISILAIVSDLINPIPMLKLSGALISMGIALTALTLPIALLGNMDILTIVTALGAFAGIITTLGLVSKYIKADIANMLKLAGGIIALSIAFTALSIPIIIFGNMDILTIFQGLLGVTAVMATLGTVASKMQVSFINMSKIAGGLILLSTALTLLFVPIALFGTLNFLSLVQGLGGIIASIISLNLVLQTLVNAPLLKVAKFSAALILLSAGLTALTLPVAIFGTMSFDNMIQGLIGIAGALGLLIVAMRTLPNSIVLSGISTNILKITAALGALMTVLIIVGMFDLSILAKGFATLTGTLLALVVGLRLFPSSLNVKTSTILGLVASLAALAYVIKEVGKEDLSTLSKGLGVVALALTEVSLFFTFWKANVAQVAAATAGILGIAAAIMLFIPSLKELGSLEWEEIFKALVTLAGVLGIAWAVSLTGVQSALALGAFSLATIILAAAIWALTEALKIFIDYMKVLPFHLIEVGNNFLYLGSQVVGFIVDGITNGAKNFWNRLVRWWDAFWSWLFAGTAEAAEAGGKEIGQKTTAGVMYGADEFGNAIKVYPKIAEENLIMDPNTGKRMIDPTLKAAEETLETSGKTISNTAKKVKDNIETNLQVSSDVVSKPIAQSMDNAKTTIKDSTTGLGMEMGDFIGLVKNYLSGEVVGLSEYTEKLLASGMNGINIDSETQDLFKRIATSIQNGEEVPIELMNEMFTKLNNIPGQVIDPNKMNQPVQNALNQMGNSASGAIGNAFPKISLALASFQGKTSIMIGGEIVELGNKVVSSFKEGINLALPKLQTSNPQLAQAITKLIAQGWDPNAIQATVTPKLQNTTKTILNSGFDQRFIKESATKFGLTTQESLAIALASPKFEPIGTQPVVGVTNSMDKQQYKLATTSANVAKGVETTLKQELSESKFIPMGQQIINGLMQGIMSKQAELLNHVKQVAESVRNAAQTALEINSPSKVFEQIGKYVVQGFAIGLQETKSAIDASNKMGTDVIDVIKNVLSDMSMEDLDLSLNPIISPILDLDNVVNESKNINDLLNGAVNSNRINATATTQSIMSPSINQNGTISTPSINERSPIMINNAFNVRNENDARIISNRLGTMLNRAQYAKGVVAFR